MLEEFAEYNRYITFSYLGKPTLPIPPNEINQIIDNYFLSAFNQYLPTKCQASQLSDTIGVHLGSSLTEHWFQPN